MVHTSNKYYSTVHVLPISVQYIHYEINIPLTYILMSSFQPLFLDSRPMTSFHVMFYVTALMCLFFFFFLNQQFIKWHTKADHGSYFCNYIQKKQTNMKLEKKKRKEREKK